MTCTHGPPSHRTSLLMNKTKGGFVCICLTFHFLSPDTYKITLYSSQGLSPFISVVKINTVHIHFGTLKARVPTQCGYGMCISSGRSALLWNIMNIGIIFLIKLNGHLKNKPNLHFYPTQRD